MVVVGLRLEILHLLMGFVLLQQILSTLLVYSCCHHSRQPSSGVPVAAHGQGLPNEEKDEGQL